MIKSHNIVKKKSHKNVNLSDKKSQTSVKKSQNVNLDKKKSQTNEKKKSQNIKFRIQKVTN